MPELLNYLKNIILSESFLHQHRKSPKDFTRKRSLTFENLIYLLINLDDGPYQDRLDRFFQSLFQKEVPETTILKSALSHARKKLKYEAFIELNDRLIHAYYKGFKHDTWNGFNLLAWDGSTLRLPDEKPIVEHFGTWKTKTDPCPISRVSQMFDVLNKITVDAIISPKAVGERELAARHCLKLMPNDLVLMDRGYPAYWLFNLIMALGSSFCARISTKWKIVRQFEKSGAPERIVKLKPTPVSVKQCRQMGLDITPLKLRLIRVELNAGKVETLITSLLDTTEFPSDLFGDLYHLRWPVEEDYKVIKNRITVENFSGKSVLSVYQDFHAKVFSKNIAAVITRTIKPAVENRYSNLKYGYQVNFARALSKLKSTIVMLFNRSLQEVKKILKIIEKSLLKTVEQVRPGRKFERNHRIKLKKFFPAYKPIC